MVSENDSPSDASRPLPLLLSVADAARALCLGRSKTYELIAAGEIETVQIGRARRVPIDALYDYLGRLRQKSA